MKKTKLFALAFAALALGALAFAALALGACSNDDIVDQQGGSTVNPGEQGYVSVALNLPTQPTSRANDNFDDGQPVEYNVADATLLVFSGATEDAAKFTGAYPLTLDDGTQLGGNITTTYQVTQQITKPLAAGDDIYALVMINSKNVLTGSAEAGWQILGNALTTNTTTVAQVKAMSGNVTAAALADASGEGYFYMTNAPLYSVPGGVSEPAGGAVTTLTKINAENIFSTAAEAEDNPAASIYVERGVAKVTVTDGGTAGQNGNLNYTINGWTLDMTNTASYAVRNVTGADWWTLASQIAPAADYRFVGSVPVAAGLYRTYFGMDPNYNAAGTFNEQIGEAPAAASLVNVGTTNAAYCLENTFDVDHQNQDQTTRVIVAATLTGVGGDADGNDFYVINNNKDNVLNTAGLEAYVKTQYLENPEIVAILTDADAGLKAGEENKLTGEDLTVTYGDRAASSADVMVLNITVNESAATKFKGEAIPAALGRIEGVIAEINEDKIAYYKGGVSYYPVMIQHFGDEQTPWTAGSVSYPTPNRDANYLGRWGVLRNNWYEINVTGVKSIGSPVVPEVYGTPDDPVESWISVEINVLSWAKRVQNAGL